jgi:rubrerythrin
MNVLKSAEQTTQVVIEFTTSSNPLPEQQSDHDLAWTKGVCPNCGYSDADIDKEGILWCPACGFSKKGCYT